MSVHFKLEPVQNVEQFSTINAMKTEISNLQPLLSRTELLFDGASKHLITSFWEDYFNTQPIDLTNTTTWEEL